VSLLDLGTLGGTYSYALAVNDLGQVVGGSATAAGFNHAFFWSPAGGIVGLGTLGGKFSEAVAVNLRGQVIGRSYTESGASHAFFWTAAGGMVDLGTLGGSYSEARSIDDQGQVVGVSTTASGERHAFLWTESDGMKDLGTVGGNYSAASAINNRGQIIGDSRNEGGQTRGILWSLPPSSLSPEEQIKEMIETVESLIGSGELKKGIGNGLIVELRVVLKKLQKEKTKTACWLLHSFGHQIRGLVKARKLSPENGENLLHMAAEIEICADEWKGKHRKSLPSQSGLCNGR
jgi:probable HAF family extracellular repeat protein